MEMRKSSDITGAGQSENQGDRTGLPLTEPPIQQWIELNQDAYSRNLSAFKQLVGSGVKIMAVVKSNGYGHGARPITTMAIESGIDYLGLNCLNEFKEINDLAGQIPVCILGPLYASDAMKPPSLA